nr:3706_t:CDS:2 [Entrophospora candida]
MPQKLNTGPCGIIACNKTNVKFRRITPLALKKLKSSPDYEDVRYLKLKDQICHNHYMQYVEPIQRRHVILILNDLIIS